ncbi:MAG: host-nuclease inhibitor Gam family protein [Sphingobium sp.]|uniref:host-nuclease inhibitor Gam family protein n=1 Tax=Sphingobium sp. TaxID=1912891 RepID=UPI0029A0BBB1|nr:host-nuclease inhibitor Gam family protein [Sphingobium sp.]MDX3908888.1 host-nuclease inhibitor Gam family protein [Sphingobium sp.]
MARRKSPAQRAPQTLQAATVLLNRFAELDAAFAVIEEERTAGLATINATADAAVVPIVAELKDIQKQLEPWWAASVDALTGGKRKSIELGGCLIGNRTNPPKVMFEHGKDKEAVIALLKAKLPELLRITTTLDKPAILKKLDAEAEALAATPGDAETKPVRVLHDLGFGAKQTEDFFVERVAQGGTLSA